MNININKNKFLRFNIKTFMQSAKFNPDICNPYAYRALDTRIKSIVPDLSDSVDINYQKAVNASKQAVDDLNVARANVARAEIALHTATNIIIARNKAIRNTEIARNVKAARDAEIAGDYINNDISDQNLTLINSINDSFDSEINFTTVTVQNCTCHLCYQNNHQ